MAQPTSRLLVRLGLAAMAIVVVATLFSRPSSSASTYLVVDLATLKQEPGAIVRGPNAVGDAVGGGRVAVPVHTEDCSSRGGVQEVSGLSGSDYTTVFGINDVVDAVGSSNTRAAVRAFRSSERGYWRAAAPGE